MNKLTMGSLFDGIGGFVYAGNQVDIKTLWSSEIDPACEAVTKHHFPEVEQLGDITKIDGAKVDPVDIICGGSPCFPEGTLVLTETGYVPIENITENDKVLTHTGKWQRVLRYGSKIADTIVLKGQGHYGIECTPEHPFYASEKYQSWRTSESRSANSRSPVRHLSSPSWTQAKDMVGKMWATPIQLEGTQIPPIEKKSAFCKEPPRINKDFWWLVGRWLGDGWTLNNQRNDRGVGCTRGEVFIACGNYRKDGLKEKLDKVIPNWYECDNDGHSCKYRNTHVGFADWLDAHFGKYAHGKKIPSFCFSMKDVFRQALLDGICSADGYAFNEHTHKITTVSKELAIGIRLLAEGLGYSTALHKAEMKPTCIIEGRVCSQRDQYQVTLRLGNRSCGMRANTHSWYPVKEIKQGKHNIRVYNLEVEHDNSYVVENIVVHNCQDLSVAGKRAGLAGERSGLYMEQIRIIHEMRAATNNIYPRYMVWENVPGALSSNKGDDFRAVLEEAARCAENGVSIPQPKKWSTVGNIVGNGWSIAWRILDAQYWGVPQRRRRIFLVADFGSERAGEVLFKPESVLWHSAESGEAGQGIAANAEGRIGRSSYGVTTKGTGEAFLAKERHTSLSVGGCQAGQGYPCVLEENAGCGAFSYLMGSKAYDIGYAEEQTPTLRGELMDTAVCASTGVKCLNPSDPQTMRVYDADGLYPALTSNSGGGQNRQAVIYEPKSAFEENWAESTVKNALRAESSKSSHAVVFTQNQRDEVRDLKGVAASLAAESGMHQTNYVCEPTCYAVSGYESARQYKFATDLVVHKKLRKYIIRRLTPLECEKLQGFHSNWTQVTYKNKPMSDSARYRMCGNSVAIPCVVRVLGGIVECSK